MSSGVSIPVGVNDNATGPLDRIRDRFDKLGASKGLASFASGAIMGGGMAAFNMLAQGAGMAVQAIGDSIDAASDLNESMSKVTTVFGESSKEIVDWSTTAADAFGMSQQQALEAAGSYGNLFQAFGMGREEASQMSTSLVELATDLASFNNTSVDDALVALRSGLSGEAEPLKRYGVAISDARMRTELMSQGVKNLGTTLTPLQKTTAAYSLIMKDTSLAQGDFARTSDGLANKQRTLDARMGDLSAKVGGMLAPVMSSLIDIGLSLAGAFGEIVDIVGPVLGPVLGALSSAVGGLVGALAPLVKEYISFLIEGFKVFATVVLTAGEAMMGVAAAIPGPWQDGAKDVQASLTQIKDSINGVGGEVAAAAGDIEAGAEEAFVPLPEEAEAAGTAAVKEVEKSLASMVTAIRQSENDFVSAWKGALDAGAAEQQAAIDITRNLSEQKVQAAILADKKATKAAKVEAAARLAELRLEHAALLAEQATHGDVATQLARTKALLQTKAMAEGLKSGDPDVRAAWEIIRQTTVERLGVLQSQATDQGRHASLGMARGVKDKDSLTAVEKAAGRVAGKVHSEFDDGAVKPAYGWGANATRSFASGVKSPDALAALVRALRMAIGRIADLMEGASPPKEGPLHSIDVWGENVGKAWSEGVGKGAGALQLALPAGLRTSAASVPVAGAGGTAGGPAVVVNIDNFYGDQGGIQTLSRELGWQVRLATVKGVG